jgi:hypothetical protein
VSVGLFNWVRKEELERWVVFPEQKKNIKQE